MTPIAVLGAGSWGTTLANLLALKGETVRLWAYEPDVVEAVNQRHENPVFLPGFPLVPELRAFADAREAVANAPVIVSAAPSHAVRSVIMGLKGGVRKDALVVSATKGIETDTLALMSAVFEECLPEVRFAALSGPSFATEVCQGQPTLVVAAELKGTVERLDQAKNQLVLKTARGEETLKITTSTKGIEHAKQGAKVTVQFSEKDGSPKVDEIVAGG